MLLCGWCSLLFGGSGRVGSWHTQLDRTVYCLVDQHCPFGYVAKTASLLGGQNSSDNTRSSLVTTMFSFFSASPNSDARVDSLST